MSAGEAFEAGVDEDVAGGRDDEVRGQVAAAHVVESGPVIWKGAMGVVQSGCSMEMNGCVNAR